MESIRKIIIVFLSVLFISCTSTVPVTLLEIKPLPREVVIQKKLEYEPIFSIMKVLEISEVNGVQKYIIAKLDTDVEEIKIESMGEIAGNNSFDEILGTIKVISKTGGFLKCSIETSTHKIPINSYIRIQIGQKAREQ